MIAINRQSVVTAPQLSAAVDKALEDLRRDIARVFAPSVHNGAPIVVVPTPMDADQYQVSVRDGRLEIAAGDELGVVYGIYAVSRSVLGVSDLWFWNDQQPAPRGEVTLADDYAIVSRPSAVAYRGFFVNDEVLLDDWSIEGDDHLPWEYVFEALLRMGGNFVIPGSGQRGDPRCEQAHRRGLYLGQHHATPLGARMFAEAYPGVSPQWPEQRERFESLWMEAIARHKGEKVLWTLGFRGQGDVPFWDSDPRYVTDADRGALLGEVIQRQYELVQEIEPGARCCVYLYGEAVELYQGGHLTIAEDLVAIWSDNGYGRMVSRRRGNENPRVPSMPEASWHGSQGIYYHASFYDLQAGNHITQLCSDPRLIARELETVLQNGGRDVWVVNSSNLKPHAFTLSLIAQIWQHGSVDVDDFERAYAAEYFGTESVDAVVAALQGYWQAAIAYGPYWDDRAGEQFLNHVPRTLAVQFMRDRASAADDLNWMCVATGLRDQVEHFKKLCDPAVERYHRLAVQIEGSALRVPYRAGELIRDSVLLQTRIYERCSRGSALVCASLLEAYRGDYRRAFFLAGLAKEQFAAADNEMRSREHGKWRNFWRNECLTDVKQTAWVIGALMGYFRALGDGPHYYQWKRDFLYPERERNVMLVMNVENHETDDEIFHAMKAAWQT